MHIFFICPLISYCRFIYDVFSGVFYVFLYVLLVFLGKSMDRWKHLKQLLKRRQIFVITFQFRED